MKMKIERMTRGEWGSLRAFFDIETDEGFVIKGLKIVQGQDGLFVAMPSEKDKDGKYNNTVYIKSEVTKAKLEELAMDEYRRDYDNAELERPQRMVGGMSEVASEVERRETGEEGEMSTDAFAPNTRAGKIQRQKNPDYRNHDWNQYNPYNKDKKSTEVNDEDVPF